MLPSFMTQAFVRKRYPTVIDHGSTVRDYTAIPTQGTFYGSIQPGTGTTDQLNRDGAEVVKTIWAQPGSDVKHFDVLTIKGEDYFVNGAPEDWDTGILDHMVVRLSRWGG